MHSTTSHNDQLPVFQMDPSILILVLIILVGLYTLTFFLKKIKQSSLHAKPTNRIANQQMQPVADEQKTIFNQIEKIYYINLAKDKRRNKKISQLLSRAFPSIDATRFNAIDKNSLDSYKDIWQNRIANWWLQEEKNSSKTLKKPGGLGCYLSHYIILKEIQKYIRSHPEKKTKIFMVLEDDCVWGKKYMAFIKDPKVYAELPADWNILRPVQGRVIGEHRENNLYNVEKSIGHYETKKPGVKQWEFYYGTYMVIYNGHSIDHIIEQIDSKPIYDIDVLLSNSLKGNYAFGEKPKNIGLQKSRLGKKWVTTNNIGGSNTSS